MKRIPELDGIRGVAIAMVIAWHYFSGPAGANGFPAGSALAYLQSAASLAWSGVDLFFVLSGFLIGGILLDSRDSPTYFRTFYTRRKKHFLPAWPVASVSVASLAATFVLAIISWRYFEKPLIDYGHAGLRLSIPPMT